MSEYGLRVGTADIQSAGPIAFGAAQKGQGERPRAQRVGRVRESMTAPCVSEVGRPGRVSRSRRGAAEPVDAHFRRRNWSLSISHALESGPRILRPKARRLHPSTSGAT